MAEINYNNLYNQLSPMEQRYYDQQFSKNYVPGQENIMLSSQPAYEQMKAVYEAQQQVPEKSFFDFLNPFSSASAAEKPQVPNLTYRNITPTFDLATGITNTKAASPYLNLKSMADIDVSGNVNTDLVNRLIAENLVKTNLSNIGTTNTADTAPFFFPTDRRIVNQIVPLKKPTRDIMDSTIASNLLYDELPYSGVGSMRYKTPRTIADQNRVLGQTFTEKEPSGIEKLLSYVMPGSVVGNILAGILPKDSPEVRATKDFYRRNYGLTSSGSVASGIMAGYNPVSGGFLNFITGGRYGKPMQIGLADAARRRIEKIAKRKAPQTEASKAKIKELQKFARADTINRARQKAPDVYSRAEALGLTDSSGGFKSAGTHEAFSNKTGRGRTGY